MSDSLRWRYVVSSILALLLLVLVYWTTPAETHFWEYTSGEYLMDRVYLSMQGPGEVKRGVYLGNSPAPELLWLTGYRAVITDTSGQRQLEQDFMCHNSLFLDVSLESHRRSLGTRPYGSRRVFTLAHGADDLSFPAGFALPLSSGAALQLQSQSLNLTPEHIGQVLRHRIQARFQLDSELVRQPQPLFLMEATGKVLLRDADGPTADAAQHASGPVRRTEEGEVWSGHWVVPPGPSTNRTLVSQELNVPFPTTVHYATAHLHPYARWQELREAATERVVLRITPTLTADGQRLAQVPAYSSAEGVELQPGVEYVLVTHYDNTTTQDITAMSILFLYCHDKEFQGLSEATLAPPQPAPRSFPQVDDFCGQTS